MQLLLALLTLVAATAATTQPITAWFRPVDKQGAAEQLQKEHDRSKEASKQAAEDRKAHELAAAATKRKPGRPRKQSIIVDRPLAGRVSKPAKKLKEARRKAKSELRRGPKTNWWHPVLILPILMAVKSSRSFW